ncbi:BREX-1 system adenine-specific DNA-methyltransferase PglX [Hydrogenophaga taeniospiralis]|uniref:BREX-1 system adenine-specific DNA-methyltransferase PglX n=1 Tax=Hydrogenophaga taeniospiralis TaxID=65656 RepID=UPI001CF97D8C|nr:BREX-1 system adenine-specific DNA-methyltransferase PglX [Hydrogenophaga taeniospiralis]UCU92320.1 BREX-1 system adenine-specific DNA-methyltransferase PglX [Hydrogenophaga taeniospiralis]
MNKANLKSYSPQARKDFIAAVTARAHLLGLDDQHGQLKVAPAQTQGDVTIISGQAWPAKVDGQRQQLIARMQREGFAQTVEAVAYTWFNRFAALRYMELRDYLGHGHRALSSREGGLPEILAHASELAQAGDLPCLKASQVNELKLAGNRDGELYRLLLIAQCNALHQAMPFLFEHIDDETELLLPDNLLLTDSVIAKLVAEIPEEDWAEVEIIGWLYQFYISEKKDQVIGKVVKSEDIPAATQLFTPNWIVQYLVQNSVGRLWLMANPGSTLASQWPYYIQPAEQTPEVQAQLDALIQTRIREDGETLNPETITVLDPACGSGHILVVAYDVLKSIYLERGYQPRSIPRLILEKNLYGLDIDDRAAQLAGFALLMKARADDRRLFTEPPRLNVMSLRESKGLSVDELATHLAPFNVQRATIAMLVDTFEHVKTFGSLIQIPYALKTHLAVLPEVLALVKQSGELYASAAADDLLPLVQQAQVLAMLFDTVVANPPYMGSNGMNGDVKAFAKATYPAGKHDLFSMFIVRNLELCRRTGTCSLVTMQGWMFLTSFETLRQTIIADRTIFSLIQIGYNSFPEMNSKVAQACAFSMSAFGAEDYVGRYVDLNSAEQSADKNSVFINRTDRITYDTAQRRFRKAPGLPIAYWASNRQLNAFLTAPSMKDVADPCAGMSSTENTVFLRLWHEVDFGEVGLGCVSAKECEISQKKWFPFIKGGPYRKWYGNHDYVINWKDDGEDIRRYISEHPEKQVGGRIVNEEKFFKPVISWTRVSTSNISCREYEKGFIFSDAANGVFPSSDDWSSIGSFMNSKVADSYLKFLSPTINYQSGEIGRLPVILPRDKSRICNIYSSAVAISKCDWDSSEISWNFKFDVLVGAAHECTKLQDSWKTWSEFTGTNLTTLRNFEQETNLIFISLYGLEDELSPEVPESQITLTRADREKDCQRLISYAIGCMMGRYCLDDPGLIYAHAGNVGFDPSRYEKKFPADADGIVPLTDEPWFTDDAASRVREFLRAVWGPDTLEENMAWLAESLGVKGSETPDETIRRYLADKFFKDHLQTYKKRPIYWLFSSGKQGAFQALVYLHRYHEGTLARLRAEYVVPLTGKMQARLDMLDKDAQAATSTAARNKISKEIEKLKKKHLELLAYDEKLRHHADMRITLDLDDGVKVNYGKFGDLLAEVKAVTGGASDD